MRELDADGILFWEVNNWVAGTYGLLRHSSFLDLAYSLDLFCLLGLDLSQTSSSTLVYSALCMAKIFMIIGSTLGAAGFLTASFVPLASSFRYCRSFSYFNNSNIMGFSVSHLCKLCLCASWKGKYLSMSSLFSESRWEGGFLKIPSWWCLL